MTVVVVVVIVVVVTVMVIVVIVMVVVTDEGSYWTVMVDVAIVDVGSCEGRWFW